MLEKLEGVTATLGDAMDESSIQKVLSKKKINFAQTSYTLFHSFIRLSYHTSSPSLLLAQTIFNGLMTYL